jgi:hypothetical protein
MKRKKVKSKNINYFHGNCPIPYTSRQSDVPNELGEPLFRAENEITLSATCQ